MIKLIAFDMDGTILNQEKKITKRTREILRKAVDRGIEIVPATGRPFCGLGKEIASLYGVRYVLTTNGAGVYEYPSGNCLYENPMKLERFLPLMKELEPLEVMADAFVKGNAYMNVKNRHLVEEMDAPEAMKEYIRTSRTCVENLSAYLEERGDDVQKITVNFVSDPDGTVRHRDEVFAILKKYPEFQTVSGGMKNLEVTHISASKGTGLLKLAEKLSVLPEEIMAFGDSENDKAMLKMAGMGIAMANAEQEIKEMADIVTLSNEEDGVAVAIEKYAIV